MVVWCVSCILVFWLNCWIEHITLQLFEIREWQKTYRGFLTSHSFTVQSVPQLATCTSLHRGRNTEPEVIACDSRLAWLNISGRGTSFDWCCSVYRFGTSLQMCTSPLSQAADRKYSSLPCFGNENDNWLISSGQSNNWIYQNLESVILDSVWCAS
jgi:hypothetical protein